MVYFIFFSTLNITGLEVKIIARKSCVCVRETAGNKKIPNY